MRVTCLLQPRRTRVLERRLVSSPVPDGAPEFLAQLTDGYEVLELELTAHFEVRTEPMLVPLELGVLGAQLTTSAEDDEENTGENRRQDNDAREGATPDQIHETQLI